MNLRSLAVGAGAALLLTGCNAAPAAPPSSSEPSGTSAAAVSPPASALPTGSQPVTLDPADFTAEIDHPYWPMKPGTRWTYREDEGGEVKEVVVAGATEHAAVHDENGWQTCRLADPFGHQWEFARRTDG